MNILILTLYIYSLFSVSQGSIVFKLDEANPNGPIVIEFLSEPLNTTLEATNLNDYVDPEVKPCDNFYLFSCGKWIKTQKKIYEHSQSFIIGNPDINFFKFLNEFYKGKFNDMSRTIKNLHNLLMKCNVQPESSIADCRSKILNFGNYATSSLFLNENKINSEMNGDYNIIEDMIERIKEEFRLLIDEKKDIFDEETRQHFLHKLYAMKFEKNFDKYDLSNVASMEDCYDNIGINYNDRIENIVETIKHFKALSDNDDDNLKSCRGKIFQPNKYLNNYVFSNALYNFKENSFYFNSDYLNEPFFSRNFPMSLNYGNIGNTIAHEMLHGFDSHSYRSILEDDNKNKFNFTQTSIENFIEKSDCFVKQYETLDENIADNGGLKIAHRAYMKYLQSIGGKDLVVPGFEDFTNEQLFFISFGRSQCEYKSNNYLEEEIKSDEHPPFEIRINMALSNYKSFSSAFKCELNSKMNPVEKCELWKKQN